MAAYTTTYEAGLGWSARVNARNAGLLAQQALRRRGARTPEFYFLKSFDNSRLIKAPDPARVRQIRLFSTAITILFSLTMLYGLQHFSAIESGYRVESEKQALEQLREDNRQLRLSEAQLTDPGRIDRLAREQGLAEPQPGQIIRPSEASSSSAPALALVTPPSSTASF
ncbi:MAG TPA: cell division protein FtsL [Terracidiphilus sp.]|jgi:cell division protein FtsL